MKSADVREVANELGCVTPTDSSVPDRPHERARYVHFLFPLGEQKTGTYSGADVTMLVEYDLITKEEFQHQMVELLTQKLQEGIELRQQALVELGQK